MADTIYTGQGIAKDCIVGDRYMNRYCIFNGLERPRRIDHNLAVTLLGFDPPTISSVTSVATAGSLEDGKWYAYKAVYASFLHTRPTAVADDTTNASRGNGSTISSAQESNGGSSSMDVVVPGSSDAGVTHIFLYRSTGASTQAAAEAGPFNYVAQAANAVGNVTINDGLADASRGVVLETDNFPPNSYRYAVSAFGYVFAGGNYPIGKGYTCTVTAGSSSVVASSGIFYDGIRGWTFKCIDDSSGGVDGGGLYYASYVNETTLQLEDADGNAKNYDGSLSGGGQSFIVFLPGYVLRWSKEAEPESWPATNLINFEGDITGIAVLPNVPLLLVCTDTPSMWILDLTLIGTYSFKTQKRVLSTEYTASSHYSLVGVDTRLRGIDAHRRCIWETNGVSVVNLTKHTIPDIWGFLSESQNNIKNWHCAYNPVQMIFGAFVTFRHAHRMVDFCIGQHVSTKGWFFHWEKDLLCTGMYQDPETGEVMVLGGTEGRVVGGVSVGGAVWGRIWCPNVYDEWIPSSSLRSGTIDSATSTTITADVSGGTNFFTDGGGLSGRWVLVCDANGESAQLAYIQTNTADTITIDSVLNSVDSTQFNPVPSSGWKFYCGLIEMRWGPKRFDFGDPDVDKKVMEVLAVIENYNEDDLPFIRLYRGSAAGYERQNTFVEGTYRDGDKNQGLYSRYKTSLEPTPRWGVAIIDRSYDKTILKSLSVVYHKIEEMRKNERKRQNKGV